MLLTNFSFFSYKFKEQRRKKKVLPLFTQILRLAEMQRILSYSPEMKKHIPEYSQQVSPFLLFLSSFFFLNRAANCGCSHHNCLLTKRRHQEGSGMGYLPQCTGSNNKHIKKQLNTNIFLWLFLVKTALQQSSNFSPHVLGISAVFSTQAN